MCYAYRAARTVIIIVFLLFLLLFPFLFPYVFRETYKLIEGEPSQSDLGDTFADLLRSSNFPANCVLHTHTQTRRQTGLEIAFLLRIIIVNMKFQKLKSECQKKCEEEKKNKLASDPNLEMTSYAAFGRVASAGPMISGKRSL